MTLKKDQSEAASKPLSPLSVNAASAKTQPTEKELAAAKEARIRLGYESEETTSNSKEPQLPSGEEPIKRIEAEYISTEDLTPLEDPTQSLSVILDELKTRDWQEMIKSVNIVRSLVVHHKVEAMVILEDLIPAVLKLLKNPRSSVSKTAILCFTDMVFRLKNEVLPWLDLGQGPQKKLTQSVLFQLFLKSSTDKQFITEEIQKTLKSIGTELDVDKTMDLVIPYTQHKNQNVRGKAGLLLVTLVDRLQDHQFTGPVLSRLLQVAAGLITDKTPDARESAKLIICKLKSIHDGQQGGQGIKQDEEKATEGDPGDSGDSYMSYSDDEDQSEKPPSQWKVFCEQHLTKTQALAVLKAS